MAKGLGMKYLETMRTNHAINETRGTKCIGVSIVFMNTSSLGNHMDQPCNFAYIIQLCE